MIEKTWSNHNAARGIKRVESAGAPLSRVRDVEQETAEDEEGEVVSAQHRGV